MFVKTRIAGADGWSIYTGVSEVHTDNIELDTLIEFSEFEFDREKFDVRENVNWGVKEERAAIDENPNRKHELCVITVNFADDRKRPLKLPTNMRTFLCCDDGSTAQTLTR